MKYLIPLLFLLVACSGGEAKDEILHLRDQDVSVENYRAHVRANLLTMAFVCRGIEGLSFEAAHNFMMASGGAVSSSTPPADGRRVTIQGATPKLGQAPTAESQERVTRIFMQECKR